MARDMGTRMPYSEAVGRARQELYRGTYKRLKEAIEAGFWIEAIALCESIISDRIQARISHLGNHDEESRRIKMLGVLVKHIKSVDSPIKFANLSLIYHDIENWNSARNKAIHRAVKINVGDNFRKWDHFYEELEVTARDGADICRRLSNEYNKIKRADLKKEKNQS
jgi:hypothetical protein